MRLCDWYAFPRIVVSFMATSFANSSKPQNDENNSFFFHIENSIRIWLKPFADSKQVFVFKLNAAHCRKKIGQF